MSKNSITQCAIGDNNSVDVTLSLYNITITSEGNFYRIVFIRGTANIGIVGVNKIFNGSFQNTNLEVTPKVTGIANICDKLVNTSVQVVVYNKISFTESETYTINIGMDVTTKNLVASFTVDRNRSNPFLG